jgi:sugar fermentation stimulation protein A
VRDIRIPLDGPLVESRFVERPNRFLLRCRVPGERVVQEVHMADPGRLRELLIPDRRVWIRPAAEPGRKTRWSAVLVERPDGEGVVSIDTSLPNRLIRFALQRDALRELHPWKLARAEWAHGRSRFDFLLEAPGRRPLAMEVKSVTLVEGGIARFPDAVTARGARHVRELTEMVGSGEFEAAVLFVLQRDDARVIEAAPGIDPDFASALSEARETGVRVLGRRCVVGLEALRLGAPVPVR